MPAMNFEMSYTTSEYRDSYDVGLIKLKKIKNEILNPLLLKINLKIKKFKIIYFKELKNKNFKNSLIFIP